MALFMRRAEAENTLRGRFMMGSSFPASRGRILAKAFPIG